MNARALSEVYSIINIMNPKVIKKIPSNFYQFIQINRDPMYNPKFKELPQNFENLEHDTKIILALIYKKYFYEDVNNINEIEEKNYLKNKIEIEKNDENSKSLVVYKKSLIEKIKEFFKKLKKKSL